MAMTYQQSADLMKDPVFISRVKVACLKYADFISNEASSVAGHSSRYRWAQSTMSNPESAAQTVTSPTVMDAAVQSAGSAITDPALQSSVEATINKLI